eukprot:7383994-Prymnesium_polylepis.1
MSRFIHKDLGEDRPALGGIRNEDQQPLSNQLVDHEHQVHTASLESSAGFRPQSDLHVHCIPKERQRAHFVDVDGWGLGEGRCGRFDRKAHTSFLRDQPQRLDLGVRHFDFLLGPQVEGVVVRPEEVPFVEVIEFGES